MPEGSTSRKRLRAAADAGARLVLPVAIVLFVAGAVYWFIETAGDPEFAAGDAFAGLGYLAAALGIVLVAVLAARMLGGAIPRRLLPRRAEGDDRAIIHSQLAWGSLLVLAGAILGVMCLCFVALDANLEGPVLALATAVIGAGATLLPAGAASAAATRMQVQAVGPAPVAVTTVATRTSPTTARVAGTVSPLNQDVQAYAEFRDDPEQRPDAPVARVEPGQKIAGAVPSQTVEIEVPGLEPAKAYQARVVAETPDGRRGEGDWLPVPREAV